MSELNKQILFKKFEIISCYKKNEHSAVYLANHIYLEKKVFLKVLNTKTIPDSSITERFKREAKILAQLEHPNIIKVFDFGMFDEFFYISFEYFESKNLREVLNSEKLTEELKRNFLIQLVKGLNFAHQKNVIHRDIKPENILVNEKYELKLTDFGLAQDSIDSLVTQMYAVVGTPAYMSPEQIQGEKLTHKSDLFSLGIIAIELFSGKNPFLGEDSNETINNIISFDETNSDELFSNLQENIYKIVKGLLAQNPNNRFNSCAEILEILNVEKEDGFVKVNASNKKLWLTIATVGIIFALLFAYYIFKPNNVTKFADEKLEANSEINNEKEPINKEPADTSMKDLNSFQNEKQSAENLIATNSIENSVAKNDNIILENIKRTNDMGELFIKCYPWAKVYLDNKFFETTPLTKNITAKEGKYLLTLKHPDYPEYSDSIKITASKLSFIEINLDTLFGYFDCQVYPWSEVFINGINKGVTPLENPIRLGARIYKVRLENPQYKSLETNINISRNDTLEMRFNLELREKNNVV